MALYDFCSREKYHRAGKSQTKQQHAGPGGKRPSKDDSKLPASHYSWMGFVYTIPIERIPEAHALYAKDIQNGVKQYLMEVPWPTRRLALDFDIDKPADDEECIRYVHTLQRGLRKIYTQHQDKLGCVLAIKRNPFKPNKVGMHVYFFNLIVNLEISRNIYAYLIQLLNVEHPRPTDLKPWSDVFDEGPFTGSLRLIGSGKVTECGDCLAGKSKEEHPKNTGCNMPNSMRCFDENVYLPSYVLDADGKENARVLKLIQGVQNIHKAIMICTSWVAPDRPLTPTFFPKDAPKYHPRKKMAETEDSNVIHEVDGGRKRRTDALIKRASDGLSLNASIKKRVLEKGKQAFSKDYLEYMSSAKSWKIVPEEDLRFKEALNFIRLRMGPFYRNLDLVELRHPGKQDRYLAKVDGIGVRYCQNKCDHHTSSSIYFTFDRQYCYQRCTSRKKEVRSCGVCSEYTSMGTRLTVYLMHLLYPYKSPVDKKRKNSATPSASSRASPYQETELNIGSSRLAALNSNPLLVAPISADLVLSTAGVPGTVDRPLFLCKHLKPSATNVAAIATSLAMSAPPTPVSPGGSCGGGGGGGPGFGHAHSNKRSFISPKDRPPKVKRKKTLVLVRAPSRNNTPQQQQQQQQQQPKPTVPPGLAQKDEEFRQTVMARLARQALDAQTREQIIKVL